MKVLGYTTFKEGSVGKIRLGDESKRVVVVDARPTCFGKVQFTVEHTAISKGRPLHRGEYKFLATHRFSELGLPDMVTNVVFMTQDGQLYERRYFFTLAAKNGFDLWTAYIAFRREEITKEEFLSMVEVFCTCMMVRLNRHYDEFMRKVRKIKGFEWRSFFDEKIIKREEEKDEHNELMWESCERIGSAAFTYGT